MKKNYQKKAVRVGSLRLHAYRGVYRENNDLTLPYIIYILNSSGLGKNIHFFQNTLP